MKKIFAVLLAVFILLGIGTIFASAAEADTDEPIIMPVPTISSYYLPRPTPILNPPDEDDVIDFSRFEGKTFEEIIDDFFTQWGIDPEDVTFGYYNIVTGDEYYHEGDKYMVAASVYKLPLNMYYTEKIYNGELSWNDTYNGSPYHAIQVSSIISSNNALSEALQKAVGDNNAYREAIAYLFDVDTETVEEEYYNTDNKYTARQMIACLKKLYGNRDIYVNMEEYMLMAAPNSHFTAAEHRYVVPHKYGYLTYNGHNYYNDAAIIYTPHPILLVMFTDNCAGGANTLTRFCTLMCDYSEYTRYLYEEAAKATPTPTPTPTPEETPEPIATPEIVATPEPTVEVTPTVEIQPEVGGQSKIDGRLIILIILCVAVLIALRARFGKSKIVKIILRGITIIVALALMISLLGAFITGTGSELNTVSTSVSAGISTKYDDFINNAKSEALDGIVPIKKMYRLDRKNPIAPEPDQSNFGETDDPAVIEALIEEASDLIDGQQMVWNSAITLRPGTKVQYYYDETILVLTWKEVINRAVYTFSEVKIADPSQFRRYLADNTFGSSVQYATSDMAATVNAVMAMSGDFYKFRSGGMVVHEGSVKRLDGALVDTCCIDSNGDLIFVHKGEITDQATAEKFVQDNDIIFSLAFGPILIENGVNVTPGNYIFGEINDIYARAAIGQMDSLHYLMVTVNTEEPTYTNAATVRQLGDELVRRGVPKAYTMDGGQTATIVVNDRVINSVEFGFQRNISDIIYFATALPEVKSE